MSLFHRCSWQAFSVDQAQHGLQARVDIDEGWPVGGGEVSSQQHDVRRTSCKLCGAWALLAVRLPEQPWTYMWWWTVSGKALHFQPAADSAMHELDRACPRWLYSIDQLHCVPIEAASHDSTYRIWVGRGAYPIATTLSLIISKGSFLDEILHAGLRIVRLRRASNPLDMIIAHTVDLPLLHNLRLEAQIG